MIDNFLTMTCKIEKKSGSTFDSHRNPVITWDLIGDNVPCFLHYQSNTSQLNMGMGGLNSSNIHMLYLKKSQEIGDGYKITCANKTYYARSSNLVFNPKTKAYSHIECVLEVERT